MTKPRSRVSRVLMRGPLVPFAEAYRTELERRGYTPLSTVNQLRQVGRLSLWLQAHGCRASELSEERIERFLASQRAAGRHRSQWSRPGLVCLLEVLRDCGIVALAEPAPADSPVDLLLASFERYLLVERGLAAGTVRGYLAHAHSFLDGLGSGGELAGLSAGEVSSAVLRKADSGVSVSAAQYFVSALRAFLRFCFLEGLLEADLSQAALAVRRPPAPAAAQGDQPGGCQGAARRLRSALCAGTARLRADHPAVCAWGCAEARSPRSGWMTSTGAPGSCWCTARAAARTGCR